MPYCVLSDILDQIEEARLIQLTDDEGVGSVNAARVEKAISDADEEINGYIGAHCSVPVEPAPAILRKHSVDIAVYNLYGRRDNAPEIRTDRYKSAIRFLEGVAAGRISLGSNDPGGNPPTSDAPELSTDNPRRVFTRSSMNGF